MKRLLSTVVKKTLRMKSKIDINTVIGFLLIGGILLYFGYFNAPESTPEVAATEQQSDTTAVADGGQEKQAEELASGKQDAEEAPDSATLALLNTEKYGPFALAASQNDAGQTFSLENEKLRVEIAALGGQIVSAELKNYRTYDSLPLYLINEQNSNFNIALEAGKRYYTADLPFAGKMLNDTTLELVLEGEGQKKLVYRYSLGRSDFMLNWNVFSQNMADMLPGDKLGLTWEMKTIRHEKNRENELTMTAIEYRYAGEDDVDDLIDAGSDEESLEEPIKWLAYKQQFFSAILLNQSGDFTDGQLVHRVLDDTGSFTKYFASNLALDQGADGNIDANLGLYLGPNKYEILKGYDQEFEKLIPLGWGIFGWINRGAVIPIFNWLNGYNMSYGIIILIIALLFKMVLFPLTYQSYRSMAKMRVLKPEIDELNEKYKDKEPMQKQQATMELYQKAGVNPLGGCLPMLLQLPILIALFRFFPASIELRQEAFLWADDLSTYDSIYNLPFTIPFYGDHISLFTLLMTVSTLIYTYMNQQLTGSAQNQQFPQMKYIIYFMPLIFLGVFNNYAAGLSYYYFVANVITFGQQFAIRSFIDEDKIRAKIQEKKNKPKKENRLMRRMKEMQEQQNRQTRRKK